jgi:serine/threonine protein kinase
MQELIGRTLGQYQVIEQIGQGGMATVFRAFQPSLERDVAIKIMPPYYINQPGFQERFVREAKAVARLEHPHILPVHDFGQADGYTYIVMKYVPSGTLKDLITDGPMSLSQTVEIIDQIAGALDCAHAQGIIHRDVKPTNILMDQSDWVLLTDFGLARMTEASVQLTGSGVGVGTPAYMAPEQGQGHKVDARADVYSLGIVLYEILTGRVPYDAETPMAVVIKHITEPLPLPRTVNPEIPEPVQRVILKALSKDPQYRYSTPGELAQALRRATEDVDAFADEVVPMLDSAPAMPDLESLAEPLDLTPVPPAKQPMPWWVAVIGAVALLSLIGVVLVMTGVIRPPVAHAPAVAAMLSPTAVSTPPLAAVATQSPTRTPTATKLHASPTSTHTPTATWTPTPAFTPTSGATRTPTPTFVPTSTATWTPTLTLAPTSTPTVDPLLVQTYAFVESITSAIADREPDLQDDFSDPASGWWIGPSESEKEGWNAGDRWYEDGEYVIVAGPGTCYESRWPLLPDISDAVVEIDWRFVSGMEKQWNLNLRHRHSEPSSGYGISTPLNGKIRIGRYDPYWGTPLERIERSVFLKYTETHTLRVLIHGPRIAALADNQFVTFAVDQDWTERFESGILTVQVCGEGDTPLKVHFDNFKLWNISD